MTVLAPGGGAGMVKNFLIGAVEFYGAFQVYGLPRHIFTRVCFLSLRLFSP
jgi:hypothetical protein